MTCRTVLFLIKHSGRTIQWKEFKRQSYIAAVQETSYRHTAGPHPFELFLDYRVVTLVSYCIIGKIRLPPI